MGQAKGVSVAKGSIIWENSKTVPFKLARSQFEAFCRRMAEQEPVSLIYHKGGKSIGTSGMRIVKASVFQDGIEM
jgi:hypothetical protein